MANKKQEEPVVEELAVEQQIEQLQLQLKAAASGAQDHETVIRIRQLRTQIDALRYPVEE
jgi:hypothetical protein